MLYVSAYSRMREPSCLSCHKLCVCLHTICVLVPQRQHPHPFYICPFIPYVSIRQHTSAEAPGGPVVHMCPHNTSAYVSIRHVSIRQHTSVYVSIRRSSAPCRDADKTPPHHHDSPVYLSDPSSRPGTDTGTALSHYESTKMCIHIQIKQRRNKKNMVDLIRS